MNLEALRDSGEDRATKKKGKEEIDGSNFKGERKGEKGRRERRATRRSDDSAR